MALLRKPDATIIIALSILVLAVVACNAAADMDDPSPTRLGHCLATCGSGILSCGDTCGSKTDTTEAVACWTECGATDMYCLAGCLNSTLTPDDDRKN
ncbi:hypothetical protein DM860_018009 [Cuscuta australis]|uniref:Acidic protein n=1 Tax=Cuscuta australis TaxID=267555 RepID=A0A328D442_9ASTE|nr:hypothetical protein DM860_018009 [Cuscuta australis]